MAHLDEIVTATARATKKKRVVTDDVCRAFLRQVQAALARDGEVEIVGFGRFTVKQMAGWPYRDFETGEIIGRGGPKERIWFKPYQRTVRPVQKKSRQAADVGGDPRAT